MEGISAIKALAFAKIFGGGGGGSSRLVTGTFEGKTAGEALNITIPYTGNGYPIAICVYPSTGTFAEGSDIYNLVQKSAITAFAAIKVNTDIEPSYLGSDSSEKNKMTTFARYKNSTDDPTALSTSAGENQIFTNAAPYASPGAVIRCPGATVMSVFIAGSSYGFPKDIEFTYNIVYSE